MPDRLTDEQIAELRKLEREATPRPWHDAGEDRAKAIYTGDPAGEDDFQRLLGIGPDGRYEDVRLSVALRNAAPALLDEVEEARKASGRIASPWLQDLGSLPEAPEVNKALRVVAKTIEERERAASALLKALANAADALRYVHGGNTCAEQEARDAIALAREAGIG